MRYLFFIIHIYKRNELKRDIKINYVIFIYITNIYKKRLLNFNLLVFSLQSQ